ncbi:MAG: phosphoadenosine phosphosulfate reductase [Leptolyngbya sp. SIO4C1]|nr:phosphoadenosine phosphosulfate reductase [Leptolyngbya sp. SIO4C1]
MVQCIEALQREQAYQVNLDWLNRAFATASPQEILAWCLENIPSGLVQLSSFSTLTIAHMLKRDLKANVPVVFLDTLHLFPETLETMRQASAEYDLDVHIFHARGLHSRQAFARRYGDRLWEHNINRFYELTKIEPMQRAFDELNVTAWITGRRRDQSETREQMPIFERDRSGLLKINPLANWTKQDLWKYIVENDVLYNPLYDRGYSSIGDEPLTTPTSTGEDERAGRWRGSEKTECGIHL